MYIRARLLQRIPSAARGTEARAHVSPECQEAVVRLLDLFCGAGGAAMGYHRAGFEVVGVDHMPQKHYPFEFHQVDAFTFVEQHGHEFDVIHASPPCQAYSYARFFQKVKKEYPDLVGITREALLKIGRPFVIENVPLAPMEKHLLLCGSMFGERWHRHRIFESSEYFLNPDHSQHRSRGRYVKGKIAISHMDDDMKEIGVDWMPRMDKRQAIPPAYTFWIGQRLMEQLHAENI